MNENIDLWGNILDESNNAEKVLKFLTEQAELLSSKTQGKVKAVFEKIEYNYTGSNYLKSYVKMAESLQKITISHKKEIEDEKLKGLENASKFYQTADYKFELCSDKYRYRVFILKYSSIFPLKLDIEYGVLEEKALSQDVYTFDELKSYLTKILRSNKVRYIIQKMSNN